MSFDRWRKRLAGEKVVAYTAPDLDDEGYYRKPLVEPKLGPDCKTNGQKRIIGWVPVAYFIDRGKLCGVIGDRDMAINEVADEGLWSWVVSNPISEELFRAVSERGDPWPDLSLQDTGSLYAEASGHPQHRVIERDHNNPPENLPEIAAAEAVDNAIGVAKDFVIGSDAEAAQALGIKNRLAELRLAADKKGKSIYEPLHAIYAVERDKWLPIVKRAKDAEDALNKRYLTFREQQRRAAEKAAAEAAAEQARIDEENERAAQRAIARGEPEAAPVITEAPPAAMPAPAPVVPTYQPKGARKVAEVEKWHFDEVEDWDALYAYVKDTAEIRTAMTALATAMVKAGRDVPGVKRHFGLV